MGLPHYLPWLSWKLLIMNTARRAVVNQHRSGRITPVHSPQLLLNVQVADERIGSCHLYIVAMVIHLCTVHKSA